MTDNVVAADINGVKVILDSNTTIITLKGASLNGTVTLTDIRNNTKYQVPTGKKAKIIFVVDSSNLNASNLIAFADNQDGTTNAVTLYQPGTTTTNVIFISANIPADKFINITGDNIDAYDFEIVEESAT